MKNKLACMLCSLSLVFSTNSFADPEVITLEKGEPAPYSGTLLNPEASARILATGQSELQKCLITSKRDLAVQEAESTLVLKNKEAELAACMLKNTEQQRIYTQQIEYLEKRANQPEWVKPTLFAGGVLTGMAVVVLSAYTLDKIQEN